MIRQQHGNTLLNEILVCNETAKDLCLLSRIILMLIKSKQWSIYKCNINSVVFT